MIKGLRLKYSGLIKVITSSVIYDTSVIQEACVISSQSQRIKTKKKILSLSKVILLISMVELDNRRSGAKTLPNNLGLNTYRIFEEY